MYSSGPRQIRSEERPALHVARNLQTREIHDRRPEVDRADKPVVAPARLTLSGCAEALGNADDQGDMRARIVQPTFRTRQADAMIGPEKHNRIFIESILFELFEQAAGPGIHRGDELVVALPVLSHDRRVGVIRR